VSTGVAAAALLDPAAGALALLVADVVSEFVGVLAVPVLLLLLHAAAVISASALAVTTASRAGPQRNFGRFIAAPFSTRRCEVCGAGRDSCRCPTRRELPCEFAETAVPADLSDRIQYSRSVNG